MKPIYEVSIEGQSGRLFYTLQEAQEVFKALKVPEGGTKILKSVDGFDKTVIKFYYKPMKVKQDYKEL